MSRFSTMRPPARRHPEPKVPRTHLGRTASNRFCHAPLPPAQVAPHLLTRRQQPPKHLEGRCRWTAAAPRVPPTVSSPGRSVPGAQPAAGSAPHNATPAWQHSLNGACQPRWAGLNDHRELSPGGEENRALHGVAALRRPPLIVRAHAAVGLAVLARGMHATEQPLCAATTTEGLRSIAAHSGGCVCGLLPSFSHAPRSAPVVDAVAPRAPARPRPDVGPRSSWPSHCRRSMFDAPHRVK